MRGREIAYAACVDVCLVLPPSIPVDQLNSVARYLEGKGHAAEALQVATDPHYK